jgi:hypothetical protein
MTPRERHDLAYIAVAVVVITLVGILYWVVTK